MTFYGEMLEISLCTEQGEERQCGYIQPFDVGERILAVSTHDHRAFFPCTGQHVAYKVAAGSGGAPRAVDLVLMRERKNGTLCEIDSGNDFGFIRSDLDGVKVHWTFNAFPLPPIGTRLIYNEAWNQLGVLRAENVELVSCPLAGSGYGLSGCHGWQQGSGWPQWSWWSGMQDCFFPRHSLFVGLLFSRP